MTPCDHIEHLLPLQLSGDLSRIEQQEVETHLKKCAHCRQYLASLKFITTAIAQDKLEVPESYGAELVVKLNRRLDRRHARQRRLLWSIPALTTTLVLLIVVGISLLQPHSSMDYWSTQFEQEYDYLNLLNTGYFGEILLEEENGSVQADLSIAEIYRNIIYQLVESRDISNVNSYVMATASLSDDEFQQVLNQLKSEIL